MAFKLSQSLGVRSVAKGASIDQYNPCYTRTAGAFTQLKCHSDFLTSPNLIICGFKGCGKTTFGKALAKEIGYDFIDTDPIIADDCRSFYKKVGEEAFRIAEKKAIASLKTVVHTVIATGGGAILDPDNIALFKKIGKIIYIKEEKQTVKTRLLQKPYPAFFSGKDIEREFEEMYSHRVSIYEAIWDITHLGLSCKSQHGGNLMEKLSALSSMVVLQD